MERKLTQISSFDDYNSRRNFLNESVTSNIKNWFSKKFGGAISKIDSLISKWKSEELANLLEIEKMEEDILNLEIERNSIKKDPALYKANESHIKAINKKISSISTLRDKLSKELFSKIERIIVDNKRLREYYDVAKGKAEISIYKKLINEYSWSDTKKDDLYKRYKNTIETTAKKEENYEGNLSDWMKTYKSSSNITKSGITNSDKLLELTLDELKIEASRMSTSEIRTALSHFDTLKKEFSSRINQIRRDVDSVKKGSGDRTEIDMLYKQKDEFDDKYSDIINRQRIIKRYLAI